MSNYIQPSGAVGNEQAIAAGCTGTPEVVTAGGIASSAASLTFSTNFAAGDSVSFGGVTLTAVASSPNALQFVPGANLGASLASLVTQLQALPQPVAGTYSQNGTVLTFTPSYGVTSSYTTALPDVTAAAVQAAGGNSVAYSASTGATTQTFAHNLAVADTVTFQGTTLTAVASAPSTNQFVPGANLQETLASLVNQFTSLLGATAGHFSSTPTTLAFTANPVASSAAYHVSAVKTSGGTNTAAQSNNAGSVETHLSLATEHSQLQSATANQFVYLDDGVETQRKTVSNIGSGTFNLVFAHAPTGVTNQIAVPANAAIVLQFLAAQWRLIFNDGATLS